MSAAQVVKRGRGHPRAYLLPSPVGKATDPEETFRPAVCPRSKVSQITVINSYHNVWKIFIKRLCHSSCFTGPDDVLSLAPDRVEASQEVCKT